MTRTLTGAVLLILGTAAMARAQEPTAPPLPTVELPAQLERVLRDYEAAWQARDAHALAALFAPDGFVMAPGHPPARGTRAIREYYTGRGGPLSLRALAYAMADSVAYVIGGYGPAPGARDGGKFTLTLRKGSDGHWLIMSDMDNPNLHVARAEVPNMNGARVVTGYEYRDAPELVYPHIRHCLERIRIP